MYWTPRWARVCKIAHFWLIDGKLLRALSTKLLQKCNSGKTNHLGMVKKKEIGQSAAKNLKRLKFIDYPGREYKQFEDINIRYKLFGNARIIYYFCRIILKLKNIWQNLKLIEHNTKMYEAFIVLETQLIIKDI